MAPGLMTPDLARYFGVALLQLFSSPFRQACVLERGDHVVKLGFKAFKFCAKHHDLLLRAAAYAAHLAISSFLLNPRM